jgi:hypothetical protein
MRWTHCAACVLLIERGPFRNSFDTFLSLPAVERPYFAML